MKSHLTLLTSDCNEAQQMQEHFSARISNHVRALMQHFRKLGKGPMDVKALDELALLCEKLMATAKRYNRPNQLALATQLRLHLRDFQKQGNISQEQSNMLKAIVFQLGQTEVRKQDKDHEQLSQKSPILLALKSDVSRKLSEQLELFSVRSLQATDHEHFLKLHQHHPNSRCIVDMDFKGEGHGLALANRLPKDKDGDIIFVRDQNVNLKHRLEAIRCGGEGLLIQPSIAQLIQTLDLHKEKRLERPYRILIVDDSKTQAKMTSRILAEAGMETRCLNEPMETLVHMDDFHPDLILMDMYMPDCSGSELASVIRQLSEYVRIPILFLSGEENKSIQLGAMAQGGDDFLTKPVDPKHLVRSVQNRGARARTLNDLIVRDSLTKLYNHTHILEKLDQQIRVSNQNSQPLCFAMVDIDLFKGINDNYGHPTGDKVICALSLFLKQRLRQSDDIGRYGGEEFAVVLSNTTQEQAEKIMNDIRIAFNKLVHPSDKGDFQVSFSCGICQYNQQDQATLLAQADEALYEAKAAGRNNVTVYKR